MEGMRPTGDDRFNRRPPTGKKTPRAGKFDSRFNLTAKRIHPTHQQLLRRRLIILLSALVLAVAAVLTNPDQEQHTSWRAKSQPRSGAVHSEYHNYLFFSTTTGDSGDSRLLVGCFGIVRNLTW